MSAEYYRTIVPTLPTELAIQLERLCQSESTVPLIDALIRFVCGAGCPETLSDNIRTEWSEKQQGAKKALYSLLPPSFDLKRPRQDDDQNDEQTSSIKRQRLTSTCSNMSLGEQNTPNDVSQPVFTLHSVSVTSPIRKRVDITIHKQALRLTTPGAHSIEATVPLSTLRRAFLLPTRGKNKAHWTIVLLSSDTPGRGKSNGSSAQAFPQVIFGIDATASSPLTITKYNSNWEPSTETVPKGTATLPSLKTFLCQLGIKLLEPTADVFKSACSGYGVNAGQGGIPGVEAYRGAKVGNLWFMKEGILWGESKPCEFWAVEDLLGKNEGLRVLTNPGGRTCTLTLMKKGADDVPEGEEDVGMESEFSMIDSREQEGINQWVRAHRRLFGGKGTEKEEEATRPVKVYAGPMTIQQIGAESDEEDEDFKMNSTEDEDDSASSESDEEDREEESEAEVGDSDAEGEEEEEEEEEEEDLKEEHHPLLRSGAVPRMSKGAMDMVVGMVEEDFLGRKEEVTIKRVASRLPRDLSNLSAPLDRAAPDSIMPGPCNKKKRKTANKSHKTGKNSSKPEAKGQPYSDPHPQQKHPGDYSSPPSEPSRPASQQPLTPPPIPCHSDDQHIQPKDWAEVLYTLDDDIDYKSIEDISLPPIPYIHDPGNGPRVRDTHAFLSSSYFAQKPAMHIPLCAEFAQPEILEMLRTILPEETALVCFSCFILSSQTNLCCRYYGTTKVGLRVEYAPHVNDCTV
ncbi:hypothetical protein AX15_005132 [Amanita polypyramis BW_CC]|nr:hypothetical protein AX15_005132 [Amanita polypyramis BW_CC]